jgi:hypothetical protein
MEPATSGRHRAKQASRTTVSATTAKTRKSHRSTARRDASTAPAIALALDEERSSAISASPGSGPATNGIRIPASRVDLGFSSERSGYCIAGRAAVSKPPARDRPFGTDTSVATAPTLSTAAARKRVLHALRRVPSCSPQGRAIGSGGSWCRADPVACDLSPQLEPGAGGDCRR